MNEIRVVGRRYELGDIIGRGGMGDVFVATDTKLGRRVAVKLLRSELATDAKLCTRFKQEARLASKLSHPNIVRVFDAGDDITKNEDGSVTKQPFIVMEYVEGLELSKLIERGPLKVSEATRVAAELLSAIAFAHEAGMVHRDIKPGNIMLTRRGHVKVLDFGIARAVADAFTDLTQTTSILGTAAYFSPEQARGERVDARSDIYAIGVVLFEVLTGKAPFAGDTALVVAHRHLHEQPPAPSTLNSKVSPAIDQVVLKALSKDKKDRYQTSADFARELGLAAAGHIPTPPVVLDEVDQLLGVVALADRPAPPVPVLPSEFSDLFGTNLDTQPRFEITESRRPSRNRLVAGIMATVLAISVIVGISVLVVNIAPTDFFPSSSRTIPDLRKMTYFEATAALAKVDLIAIESAVPSASVKKGDVVRTEPARGSVVDSGLTVNVFISAGFAQITVPRTAGMTPEDATAALIAAKFKPGSLTQQNSPNIPANTVIGTTPASGTETDEASSVGIIVSDGKIELISVRGMPLKTATDLLRGPSLLLSPTLSPDLTCPKTADLVVNNQSLAPGQIPQGSALTLTYCAG